MLLEALHSLGNSSLWENMHIDGDGEWIREGLCHGTISIAHDGSFMQEESLDICSAAVIMYCSSSNQLEKITVAECSESASAAGSWVLESFNISYGRRRLIYRAY
jgi:hypothetical protein